MIFYGIMVGQTIEKPWKKHGKTMKNHEKPWKHHGSTMEKTRKSHGNFNLDEATDRWLGEMGAMSVAWKGRIPWMWKIPMSL
jgi:hypothetical protein